MGANCVFGGKCAGVCQSPAFAEVLAEAKLRPFAKTQAADAQVDADPHPALNLHTPPAIIQVDDGQFEQFGQDIGRVTKYHHHCHLGGGHFRGRADDHSDCPRQRLPTRPRPPISQIEAFDQERSIQIDAARELISFLASPPSDDPNDDPRKRERHEAALLERFQRSRREAEMILYSFVDPEAAMVRGMAHIKLIGNKLMIANRIEVRTLHISCRSDRVDGEPMAGLVVWGTRDGESSGDANDVRWRSGYIYLKKVASIEHIPGEGQVHGSLFKSLFDKQPSQLNYVCSGFAYRDNSWRYNSSVFNCGNDGWHDTKREMAALEKHYIVAAIAHWMCKGKQNCDIADMPAP